MSTPHNAANPGDIAKTVLMPGDPLRAKYIAEQYLENPVCFNTVRNMLGFTGTYKGKRVSVMGGGMGMPSVGIYTHELFNFYDVDNIIRIGSAGSINENVTLKDVVIAMGACTDSNYISQFELPGTWAPIADYGLLEKSVQAARALGANVKVGNVVSTDIFYEPREGVNAKWASMGAYCVEMEAAALYANAAAAKKHGLAILTISDDLLRGISLSADERQVGFRQMMEIALETAE